MTGKRRATHTPLTQTSLPLASTSAEPHVHALGTDELATLQTLAAALASDPPALAVGRALEEAPGDAMRVLDAALEINRSIQTATRALAQAVIAGLTRRRSPTPD